MQFVSKRIMNRKGEFYVNKISTSNRRFIRQVKRIKNEQDHFSDPLPCEIDNHADTTCFGKNFRVVSFTSEVCSVSPYLCEYDSLNDIPICTRAFFSSLSIVTRYSSVTKAEDRMFANEAGLNQTWNPPNFAFWYVSRCPPDECNLKHSPSVAGTTSVTNFSLQKI